MENNFNVSQSQFHNNASVMSAALSGVDWPLALGSFSAAVLFLSSVTLVVMLACRKGISHTNSETLLFIDTCCCDCLHL